MACLACMKQDNPPLWVQRLAQRYADDNNCAVVLCRCSDWNFTTLTGFDFKTKTAIEIILPK